MKIKNIEEEYKLFIKQKDNEHKAEIDTLNILINQKKSNY